jgi:alpha-L-fucosidase
MDIYLGSVGRGGNLLLNVPVNREGLIAKEDSIRLMEFGAARKKIFSKDLAQLAIVKSSGKNIKSLTDQNTDSFWVGESNKESVIELEWPNAQTLQYISLKEQIEFGQRIKEFVVESFQGKEYVEIVKGTTIGHKRILELSSAPTNKIRIRITQSKAVPVLQGIEVY